MNLSENIKNQIICIGKKYKEIRKITLFGSRARGDNTERSDIDLAVYFYDEENLNAIGEIEEIETLLKLDVVIINKYLDEKFTDSIKNEEIVIYMFKFDNKFENFKKAVERLRVVAVKPFDDENILRDSLIQRFEFCYELSWKTLKEYLKYNGIITESMPRPIFKAAFEHHVIDNEQIWLDMIKDRNIASHEYNEDYIILAADRIKNKYLTEFENLCCKLGELK